MIAANSAPAPTLYRSSSFNSSRVSSSAKHVTPKKTYHFFNKPAEKNELELNQIASMERLAKAKLVNIYVYLLRFKSYY